jgi:arginine decarboxylase-like protein
VESEVREGWRNAWVQTELRQQAEALADRLKSGETMADLTESSDLSLTSSTPIQRNGQIPGTGLSFASEIFELDEEGVVMISDAVDGVVVAQLREIVPASAAEESNAQLLSVLKAQLVQQRAQELSNAFAGALLEETGVQANQTAISQIQSHIP